MCIKRFASNLTMPAALALAVLVAPAAAQDLLWTRQIGTKELDRGNAVAVDNAGNVYITGITQGGVVGQRAGGDDVFVSKYDASGAVLWTRQFGTPRGDYAGGVAVDTEGGVYVAGSTRGSFGGTSAGRADVFLIKYNASGNLLWLRQIGTPESEYARAVTVDKGGNIYIAGETKGNFGGQVRGERDAFVAKFNASGDLLFTSLAGSVNDEVTYGVAVDRAGNSYITGETYGNFGAPFAGYRDAFLAKFGPSGDLLWKRQVGTSGGEVGYSVAVDGAGDVYMAGATAGDLGGSSAGQWDSFLAKYSPSGDLLRMLQFGTRLSDIGYGLALDSEDSAYITGSYGEHNGQQQDVFLTKIDVAGNVLWTRRAGSQEDEYATAVAVNSAGKAFVVGRTEGSFGGPSAGGNDVFLAMFGCLADCDQSSGIGVLDMADFLCFQNSFVNGETYACACDTTTGPGVCDVFDFLCFQDAFVGGCP